MALRRVVLLLKGREKTERAFESAVRKKGNCRPKERKPFLARRLPKEREKRMKKEGTDGGVVEAFDLEITCKVL